MEQMGVKQKEIEATEVIIKTKDKEILIKNPQVMKITMMGNESFQISGVVEEKKMITEEDVRLVAEQAHVSKERAREVLDKTGDLAKAILELQNS